MKTRLSKQYLSYHDLINHILNIIFVVLINIKGSDSWRDALCRSVQNVDVNGSSLSMQGGVGGFVLTNWVVQVFLVW